MINYAIQNAGVAAFAGAAVASPAVDVRSHIGFGFTFQVTADLTADAVFNIQSAPASDADPCAPGTFADVPEVLVCEAPGTVAQPHTHVTIPSGTKAGAICVAALNCRPGAFVKVLPASGDTAKVSVVVTLHGPR